MDISYYHSPVGKLVIGAYDGCICLCDWERAYNHSNIKIGCKKAMPYCTAELKANNEVITMAKTQLDEYFNAKRKNFTVPILLKGTDFQKRVWTELLNIPYGSTISYATLAARIGNPKSCRAVALANSRNKISILIPCHRVIGSNGSLTGYAGGLAAKLKLLQLEASVVTRANIID